MSLRTLAELHLYHIHSLRSALRSIPFPSFKALMDGGSLFGGSFQHAPWVRSTRVSVLWGRRVFISRTDFASGSCRASTAISTCNTVAASHCMCCPDNSRKPRYRIDNPSPCCVSHAVQRKLMVGALSGPQMAAMVPGVVGVMRRHLAAWEADGGQLHIFTAVRG